MIGDIGIYKGDICLNGNDIKISGEKEAIGASLMTRVAMLRGSFRYIQTLGSELLELFGSMNINGINRKKLKEHVERLAKDALERSEIGSSTYIQPIATIQDNRIYLRFKVNSDKKSYTISGLLLTNEGYQFSYEEE